MAKVIKLNGYAQEPGYLTHNGKQYRYLTETKDRKKIMEEVAEYLQKPAPRVTKEAVVANVDFTHFMAYGRHNRDISSPKVTVVKTPAKAAELKSLTRYRYQGNEYRTLFGLDRMFWTPRKTNFATSLTQAREDVKHYQDQQKTDRYKNYLPQHNEFLIVKIIDGQYQAYYHETRR